jgi:hypothetical protein
MLGRVSKILEFGVLHLIVAYRHFEHPFSAALVHPRWLVTPPGEPFTFLVFAIRLAAIADSSSDDNQPHKILSSFSDDSVPIDAVAAYDCTAIS